MFKVEEGVSAVTTGGYGVIRVVGCSYVIVDPVAGAHARAEIHAALRDDVGPAIRMA